jgi:2-oxoglutarate dehydrogenase E2 component (dihydrolipoamide succinyltransferase)
MGESIFEGTITRWLKKTGDPVQKDEPLLEISTDKVDAEIPSPVAGVLHEIRFPEGATVQVNTVLAVISTSGAVGGASGAGEGDVATSTAVAPLSVPPAATPVATPAATQAPPAPPQVAQVVVNVVMPQMGESIIEGTITQWLKKVGDPVQKDELLFEISTDKVDAEIPSPVEGVLAAIKVPEGATVEINTVVAEISASGANSSAPEAPPASPQVVATPAAVEPLSVPHTATPAPPQVVGRRLRSSPLVRRIAKEHSLDLTQIAGSGSEGRITKEDALRYLNQHGPGSGAAPLATPAAPQVQSAPPQVVVPMSKMRAVIAQRMVESVRISPHAHTVYKIDMTRVARIRQREKTRFEHEHGVKLTYMPFIAVATIQALAKFPIVNSSLVDGFIHYHRNVNLGIAVALDWGLIVPVIKEAEARNFLGLARAIADLAERARSKKLLPDEVSGGTFTLTNSGSFGGEFGTPIINQPESAILAIGGLRKEPMVLTDAEGNDTIAIRSMQHFCLGLDHRVIDGGEAGKFMQEIQRTLEGWAAEIG